MNRIALFPASFDPITIGHLDIISRASQLCDTLIVVVANNLTKKYLLTLEQREKLVKEAIKKLNIKNIKVITSNDLTINIFAQENSNFIIRGVRNYQDFEYEVNLSLVNQDLYKIKTQQNLETIYIVANPHYKHISSSLVRELCSNQEWLDLYGKQYSPESIFKSFKEFLFN